MAKKAKDFALSMEERLEQALIPNWDEPYKLPDNWCWTKIGIVANLYRGVSYKKHEGHSEKGNNDCLVMRGGNILEGEIDTDADKIYVDKELVSKEQYVKKYDIIIVSSTGSTKVIGRAGISFANYNDVAFGAFLTLVRPNEKVYKPYISYYFQGDLYRNRMRQLASGVNINNIRNEYITDTPIPLPPFDEQQRIVDCIKSLFAKLDEAKEKAQNIVDGFETRKAAILHKAFTGELTANWREEHGVGMESWKTSTLSDVGEIVTGSTPGTKCPEYYGGNVPFIKPTELNQGRHILCSTDTLTEEGKAVSRPIRAGATCICCIGATISKCGFLEVDAVTNQQINSVIPYEFMDDVYVYYYCCGSDFKDILISNASATTLPIINKKKTSLLNITYPEKSEQSEIVRIVDDLLVKEQQAKEASEAVLEQIDTMKKAILARAFRGELGTNDPTEESAVELLKQII